MCGSQNYNSDYTVTLFTGLLDKNGKEIYEGDILEHTAYYPHPIPERKVRQVVEREEISDENVMGESIKQAGYRLIGDDHEVIGNIYENPELVNK